MDDIKIIKNIKPAYSKSLIYTRLGYSKNHTQLRPELIKEMENTIRKAEETLQITVAYRVMKIAAVDVPNIELEDGTVLSDQRLFKILEDCQEVLMMAATAGNGIIPLIEKLQNENRMSQAVVLDAVASVITDSALDFTMDMVNQQIRSKGKILTKMRFSPGYGGFDISQQQEFYRILKCEDIGIVLNDAYMLIPEKSVLAVAGILGH